MVGAGVYNRWVEQSFARLASLVPGRYAKEEQSIGLLGAIETFTYRRPGRHRARRRACRRRPSPRSAARARRRRKGPTVRLEVLADAGFTITDAARLSPELRERYLAAIGYLEQGLHERGIAELRAVTEQAPELANPHVDLGIAYGRTGDLEKAAASLENASPERGSPDRAQRARSDLPQAGPVRRGARELRSALALYPDFHVANKNLAILCDLYQRDYGCALRHYEAYHALVPDDAQVAIWLADIRGRVSP